MSFAALVLCCIYSGIPFISSCVLETVLRSPFLFLSFPSFPFSFSLSFSLVVAPCRAQKHLPGAFVPVHAARMHPVRGARAPLERLCVQCGEGFFKSLAAAYVFPSSPLWPPHCSHRRLSWPPSALPAPSLAFFPHLFPLFLLFFLSSPMYTVSFFRFSSFWNDHSCLYIESLIRHVDN